MNLYLTIKTLHILSATVLFGTGLGIAFFMFRSYFSSNLQHKYYASKNTVMADYCFTLPAAIIQPISGIALIYMAGVNPTDLWLMATYGLYLMAALCWFPVVWIQIQLKNMITEALATDTALPARYHRLFKVWFCLGWPAFIGLIVIFYLMVAKPN